MIFNQGGGGVSAGLWKFSTATALPATVAKNTMLAICATAPTTITVSDTQPASPAANDVWFHIANPEDGRAMSDGSVPIKCWGAYQYVSSAWVLCTAYYAYLGVWWELPGLPSVGTSLASCSWDQINRIGAAGKAADYFCVGDTKPVTLSTGESMTLRIIGMGHDDRTNGEKAAFTFDVANCLNAKAAANNAIAPDCYPGWTLTSTLDTTIFGALPTELQSVTKEVKKYYNAGTSVVAQSLVVVSKRIFLMSAVEITGVDFGMAGQGSQYAYYASGNARVKGVNSVVSAYWTRTIYHYGASGANGTPCVINTSGNAQTADNISTLYGVAFGLCV